MSDEKSNPLPVTRDEPLYEVKSWRSREMFVCPLCGADTFQKLLMLRHLVAKHDSELALVELVELEKIDPHRRSAPPPQNSESSNLGENKQGDVFEVDLVETDSTVDAQGDEHKTYTIKEK